MLIDWVTTELQIDLPVPWTGVGEWIIDKGCGVMKEDGDGPSYSHTSFPAAAETHQRDEQRSCCLHTNANGGDTEAEASTRLNYQTHIPRIIKGGWG